MMGKFERRKFLKSVTAGLACAPAILTASVPRSTDIRIEDVSIEFQDYAYRVPIKFGGIVSSRITLLNVNCTVSTMSGKTAKGFGGMPLGNAWSFPSGLPTAWSPAPSPDITTVPTGQSARAGLAPAGTSTSFTAPSRRTT